MLAVAIELEGDIVPFPLREDESGLHRAPYAEVAGKVHNPRESRRLRDLAGPVVRTIVDDKDIYKRVLSLYRFYNVCDILLFVK